MKFVIKAEKKKAIRQLFKKKDLVLLAKRAGNSASLLVIEIKKL